MNKKYIIFLCCFSSFAHGMSSLTRFARQATRTATNKQLQAIMKRNISWDKNKKPLSVHEQVFAQIVQENIIARMDAETQLEKTAIDHTIKQILAAHPEIVLWRHHNTGNTLLHVAAVLGDCETVALLAETTKLNQANFRGETPLDGAKYVREESAKLAQNTSTVIDLLRKAGHSR